jgi:alkylhydroperoxidase family enzyme
MAMRARLQKVLEVLRGDAGARPSLRRAALARAAALGGGALPSDDRLPDALAAWVDKVAQKAWQITDEDVAALRAAGVNEEAIFEATIAAATGAAIARYQVAMRAIADAAAPPAKTGIG